MGKYTKVYNPDGDDVTEKVSQLAEEKDWESFHPVF